MFSEIGFWDRSMDLRERFLCSLAVSIYCWWYVRWLVDVVTRIGELVTYVITLTLLKFISYSRVNEYLTQLWYDFFVRLTNLKIDFSYRYFVTKS